MIQDPTSLVGSPGGFNVNTAMLGVIAFFLSRILNQFDGLKKNVDALSKWAANVSGKMGWNEPE